MKKHIYASGCSFTEKDFIIFETKERPGWPMWPEILGNHLGLPAVNEGQGGAGNDYIEKRALRYIINNHEDIELVCMAFTQVTRFELFFRNLYNIATEIDNGDCIGLIKDVCEFNRNAVDFLLTDDYGIRTMYTAFLKSILAIQEACEKFGIKYIFAFAIDPIPSNIINHPKWNNKYHFDALIDNEDFGKINKKNFIGWPGMSQLSGFSLDKFLIAPDHTVSESDNHPNAIGQQILAQQYIDHYENR